VEHRTRYSLFSAGSFYHVLLLVMSVLGLLFYGYAFCIHLLHIVMGNDILRRVIQAVTRQVKSLAYVGALLMIIIYIYSVISFAVMRNYFDPSEGAYCNTMFQCFVSSTRLGLLSGGGLGDALPMDAVPIYDFFNSILWIRWVFDLTFFIVVTIIGLNVVFGIIVDSFSELRDEKFRIEEAMTGECFICGIKSAEFDRNGAGWTSHKKAEHNMWEYLYFFIHLDYKEATEYSYLEHTIAGKIVANEYDFFPVSQSLSLNQTGDDDSAGPNSTAIAAASDLLEAYAELQQGQNKNSKVLAQIAELLRVGGGGAGEAGEEGGRSSRVTSSRVMSSRSTTFTPKAMQGTRRSTAYGASGVPTRHATARSSMTSPPASLAGSQAASSEKDNFGFGSGVNVAVQPTHSEVAQHNNASADGHFGFEATAVAPDDGSTADEDDNALLEI